MSKFVPHEHQVAGHHQTEKTMGKPLLVNDNLVYKPAKKRELQFYEEIYTELDSLRSYFPKYHGTMTIDTNGDPTGMMIAISDG
jgi:hypothetical protein